MLHLVSVFWYVIYLLISEFIPLVHLITLGNIGSPVIDSPIDDPLKQNLLIEANSSKMFNVSKSVVHLMHSYEIMNLDAYCY